MINLSADDFRAVIAEARLAPSVHNVQPSRWRLSAGVIELLGDRARAIPVADPTWRDWRLSHGAALEGLSIALARRGLNIEPDVLPPQAKPDTGGALEPIAHGAIAAGAPARENPPVETRASWRGAFVPPDAGTMSSLDQLAATAPDLHLVRDRADIEAAAVLADRAGLHFLRDDAHRRELLEWLRLSRRHPQYSRDGLNADAMHLGAIEAFGAGLVLRPLFRTLDTVGLISPLTSERTKTRTAATIALFHRPAGEDPFVSGRAFYRAWLDMERAGLKGSPMSVLADWPEARDELHRRHGLGRDRFIVSVFRLGRPKGTPNIVRARLPVDELIVT